MGRGGHLTDRLRPDFREGRTEGYNWKIEPDGSWELADRPVVFAMSENGDYLAWDTGSRSHDGELPIFHTTRFDSLARIGDDLYDAVEWLRADVNRQDSDPVDFVALVPAAL
ncbi:hypothetical protein ASD13_15800 [Microbacterium sp. Root1433D1]|nr:hypothetical protein ASD13_15800 [Microbacterium sp. Root1433D1]